MMPLRAFVAVLVLSCAGARTNEAPAPTSSTPAMPTATSSSVEQTSAATDSGMAAEVDAGHANDAATTEAATPAPVERTGKTWPFHSWDRAEAFTFNRFVMRPGAPFRIYDDKGWSEHVAEKKPLDAALAKQAVDLVLAGKSELEMTKCPFPRHAVVLYDHDVPVASINVCFECGDILLWPRWGYPEGGTKESARKEKLFAQVFPKWKTFFRDSVGFPVDEKWH